MRAAAKLGAIVGALVLAAFAFHMGALAASIEPTRLGLQYVLAFVLFSQLIGVGYWIVVFCPKRANKFNNDVRIVGAVALVMPLAIYTYFFSVTFSDSVRAGCLLGIALTAWLQWETFRGKGYSTDVA